MRGKRPTLWPLLLGAVIAVAAGWVLYAVWRSPEQRRNDLSTYGAFAVAVVALALGWIAWAWRARTKPSGQTADVQELDHLADLLAEAVGRQWEQAARERKLLWPEPIPVRWRAPSAAMAGPVAAAVGSTRFRPLPGLSAVGASSLHEGDIRDLHAVYGGLGSGRLVIAGAPGSGKSGAAVLLILAALRYREPMSADGRAKIPVPVMFTLHGWDPNVQTVEDWLVSRLQQTYPVCAGRGAVNATALVERGKIAVILDGLDEIPGELRPIALQALNERANFRLLVLARSTEMAVAARKGLLEGAAAVELQTVDRAGAAAYLERVQLDPPPDGWRELVHRIRINPDSALARALSSPLTLTLVRDTYRSGDDARELLDANRSMEDIIDDLLDRVLPAAYAHRPGDPPARYDLRKARVALSCIAVRMNQDETRDLRWWRIPVWVPQLPRLITSALVGGFPAGLVFGILLGPVWGAAVGSVMAIICAALFAIDSRLEQLVPRRIAPVRWKHVAGYALPLGTIGGVLFGLAFGPSTGLAGGLAGLISGGLISLFRPDWQHVSPLVPRSSWRADQTMMLAVAFELSIMFGLIIGVVAGATNGPLAGLQFGATTAIFASFTGVLCYPLTVFASVSFLQLAVRWHSPIRLMRFLEDARERGVLRTVGPVYQFRHARLQDRLAEQASAQVPAQDLSQPTTV